jgi:hypothetical protein
VVRRYLVAATGLLMYLAACSKRPVQAPQPTVRARAETVTVRDPEVERRLARLEIRTLERDAQVADLQSRLDDARQEVVRAMSKLQSLASRAEAASGMAEAEVTLQTLRAGAQVPPEADQMAKLLDQSSAEFNKQNFGGALYLANQAKTFAAAGQGRISSDNRGEPRPGETPFAVPVSLKTVSRGNVREGPATSFSVVFAAESGVPLTGYSYLDEWIRVTDETGRSGWIFRNLVGAR